MKPNISSMKKTDYIQILKDSWQIVWRNKYLWWFGFFIILGGGGGLNLQLPINEGGWDNKETEIDKEEVLGFISDHFEWMVGGLIIVAFIAIILMVLRIISQAAIIKSVGEMQKGRTSSFSIGFKRGSKYFWKLFAINLIFGFLSLGLFIILFLPVVFLFYVKSSIAAVLLTILAFFIFVPLLVLIIFIKKYTYFYLVLTELSIRSSVENAYGAFCKNIATSLIMALLLFATGIIASIVMIMIVLLLAVAFLFIGLLFYLSFAKLGIFMIIALGVLTFLSIVFLFSSIREAFFQIAWLLFFEEITAVKTEKAEKAKVKIIEEKIPNSDLERA